MSKLLAMMMSKKYTRLEYIESTGTQYIDTGIYGNQDTNYKIKFQCFSKSDKFNQGILCSRENTNSKRLSIITGKNNSAEQDTELYISNGNPNTINFLNLTPYQIREVIKESNNVSVNGNTQTLSTPPTYTTPTTLKIGCIDTNGTLEFFFVGKIYYCQILDGNNTLLRDLVPVIRNSDNEIGMFDRVSGQFFGNAGTGKFRVPNEVGYTVVGSPTIVDGVVSGFSTSNYLQLSQAFNPNNKWEIKIKIKTGNSFPSENTGTYFFRSAISAPSSEGRYGIIMSVRGTRHFRFSISVDGSSFIAIPDGTYTVLANTDYWLKFGWNGNEYYLEYSLDDINYIKDISYIDSNGVYNGLTISQFGITSYNGAYRDYWLGSIYINNTNIKINNKLWFNGQPA